MKKFLKKSATILFAPITPKGTAPMFRAVAMLIVLFALTVCGLFKFPNNIYASAFGQEKIEKRLEGVIKSIKNRKQIPKEYVINQVPESELAEYTGKIYHIFFHSLIVYPELAYTNDGESRGYQAYMITRNQFNNILNELYKNQFVLIDIHSIYHVDENGVVSKQKLFIPKNKKPLIISLDDLSYYHTMTGRGFADKLVLDENLEVATQITDPNGETKITRDGDVVPILDDFVSAHPDFSYLGAKGTIALTGFEGILGYRTQSLNRAQLKPGEYITDQDAEIKRQKEIEVVKPIITRLKETGWNFASHSYTHMRAFRDGSISPQVVKNDIEKWQTEVASLVGNTDIFIGPFGQVFKSGDKRRNYILEGGFKMLCGVGMDLYLYYNKDYVLMDRADIDGYRFEHSKNALMEYFDPANIGI